MGSNAYRLVHKCLSLEKSEKICNFGEKENITSLKKSKYSVRKDLFSETANGQVLDS